MRSIKELFSTKAENLLNIYTTAGYPQLESLKEILPSLSEAGADIVEIGIPYSDPISDGVTIQKSNAIAIENGISMDLIFDQIKQVSVEAPLVLMGYFNSIFQYGVEAFCARCKEVGVTGLIIPDLPIQIYLDTYKATFDENGISNIFLVTPDTSDERIRFIDQHSTSFIYAVSSSSTTGNNKSVEDSQEYLKRLNSMNLDSAILVGFNIRTKENCEFVSQYAAGAIIGSAFIKHIANSQNLKEDISTFVQNLK